MRNQVSLEQRIQYNRWCTTKIILTSCTCIIFVICIILISSKRHFRSRITTQYNFHTNVYINEGKRVSNVDAHKSDRLSLVHLFHSGGNQVIYNNNDEHYINQQQLKLRRRTMYLPPAPVRPFSGGLKTVPHEETSDDNADTSEDSSMGTSGNDNMHPRDPEIRFGSPSSNTVSSWAP